ncbi:hypothetical protein [Mycolicibacterium arenosum]|uniref:Oxidoreductase n=1 Tax=Mycolicibacterium arenosum TaxID=2952157 RepID=A0ABT1M9G9_9MYCO|nr:hypothetical protein [Mycolicibacterium sp. CAU 1645]MCP9274422.1 hypothetical protein [Mycolicibacterium sp. CAU 1645]
MPPFTNTELISGTRPVPGAVRVPLGVIAVLGPRARRWVQRRTGSDRVFLDFDPAQRRSYEDRAQHATGLTGEGSS